MHVKKVGRQLTGQSGLKEEFFWLNANPPLHELMERYPIEWQQVGPKLVASLEGGGVHMLKGFATEAKSLEKTWTDQLRKNRNSKFIT